MIRKQQRRWGFLAILFILIASGVVFGLWMLSPAQRLVRMGYNQDEVTIITEKIPREYLDIVLEHEYLPELVELLADRATPADFRVENLEKYIQAEQKFGFVPETTTKLVNHPDYEADKNYNEQWVDILYDEYYLTERRARYFAMSDATTELTTAEIVARVNANRDREYYTETSLADLALGDLILVNKYYFLEDNFKVDLVEQSASYGTVGERMEIETYAAFEKMFAAAEAEGYQLYVTSGYRGYAEQEEVFQSYLADGDEEYALQYAARPGYSEHQTGRAIDVFTPGETTDSFAVSPVAAWLAEHAYKYGFILRYPEGKEDLTGYNYEPWHFRYVGQDAAAEIQQRGLTLEEYVAWKYKL